MKRAVPPTQQSRRQDPPLNRSSQQGPLLLPGPVRYTCTRPRPVHLVDSTTPSADPHTRDHCCCPGQSRTSAPGPDPYIWWTAPPPQQSLTAGTTAAARPVPYICTRPRLVHLVDSTTLSGTIAETLLQVAVSIHLSYICWLP
jgi:hypothetical protein